MPLLLTLSYIFMVFLWCTPYNIYHTLTNTKSRGSLTVYSLQSLVCKYFLKLC